MAIDRFHVPIEGRVAKNAALKSGLAWLLDQHGKRLFIAFNRLDTLKNTLDDLGRDLPDLKSAFDSLKQKRRCTIAGATITCGLFHPTVHARQNDACLVIWAGKDELAAVEKKLGHAGAICALPWVNVEIQPWLDANAVTPIPC